MDAEERRVLSVLSNTNKTLFDAQKNNKHRIEMMRPCIQDARIDRLEQISIRSIDTSLNSLRDEIFKMLQFSHEYIDLLKDIDAVNLYDAAEIIVEIGDVTRFKNFNHFKSYAGLAPVVKKGKHYSKVKPHINGVIIANKKQDPINYCENLKVVLTRCTKKLIRQSSQYNDYYNEVFRKLQYDHPTYPNKRLELMELKKSTIKFSSFIYSEFNKIAKMEEKE